LPEPNYFCFAYDCLLTDRSSSALSALFSRGFQRVFGMDDSPPLWKIVCNFAFSSSGVTCRSPATFVLGVPPPTTLSPQWPPPPPWPAGGVAMDHDRKKVRATPREVQSCGRRYFFLEGAPFWVKPTSFCLYCFFPALRFFGIIPWANSFSPDLVLASGVFLRLTTGQFSNLAFKFFPLYR